MLIQHSVSPNLLIDSEFNSPTATTSAELIGFAENAKPSDDPAEPNDQATEDPNTSSRPLENDQPRAYELHSNSPPRDYEWDLIHRIEGLYRLLDIYAEEGSGGLGKCIYYDTRRCSFIIGLL